MEKRRSFFKIGVGIAAMQMPLTQLFPKNKNKDKQPNLLFVFSDQHRNHALGFNGEDTVITPNIDQFAIESAVMEDNVPNRRNANGRKKDHKFGKKAHHAYHAAVSSCDHEFGRLLHTLKEEGIEEDTIVIFTSDHGEMLGSHNLMSKNVWYEESINIPFLIRWPGMIKPGRNKELFPSCNFIPTILGIMGLPVPESVEGTCRASYFLSDKSKEPKSVLIERIGVPTDVKRIALGQEPSPYVTEAYHLAKQRVNWKQNWYRGIRTKDYTYVVSRGMVC